MTMSLPLPATASQMALAHGDEVQPLYSAGAQADHAELTWALEPLNHLQELKSVAQRLLLMEHY